MVFTDTGRQITRNLLSGGSTAHFTHGAVGIGSTAASGNDTTLGSEILRKAWNDTDDTTDYETTFEMYIASTEATGTTLQEFGAFTSDTNGSLGIRNTFTALTKTSGIEVLIEQKIKHERG